MDQMALVISGSVCELGMRILMAILVIIWLGENGLFFIEVSAWTLTAAVYFVGYYVVMRKVEY